MASINGGSSLYGDVGTALQDATILLTGAVGFCGTALLFRLLEDPVFRSSVKQVLALVRGDTLEKAVARLPRPLQKWTRPDESDALPKLVVLNGDCSKIGLGLSSEQAEVARRADIVIHAAGDTRFNLSQADAIACITDIAYATARFSLARPNVKTHIHLSTGFMAWFLPHGSTIYERYRQEIGLLNESITETHANTYLHAGSLAEAVVNALLAPQAGQALHGKAARIFRLATLGPVAEFPNAGWGSGHPSSPVSAAVAAEPFDYEDLNLWMPEGAALDVVPVDVAVNQILALVAAVHRTHRLPSSDVSSPRNPACEANRPGTDLGCYAVATGVDPYYQTHMNTLNQRDTKLARPFIPKRKLLDYYRPFISKIVTFDTARARAVLGLTVQSSMLRSGRAPGGDDSNKACADGDGAWVDPPVSCGSLNIDPIQTISRKWGEVGGQNSPGWIGYLKCVRDTMEKGGSSRVWADYIV